MMKKHTCYNYLIMFQPSCKPEVLREEMVRFSNAALMVLQTNLENLVHNMANGHAATCDGFSEWYEEVTEIVKQERALRLLEGNVSSPNYRRDKKVPMRVRL